MEPELWRGFWDTAAETEIEALERAIEELTEWGILSGRGDQREYCRLDDTEAAYVAIKELQRFHPGGRLLSPARGLWIRLTALVDDTPLDKERVEDLRENLIKALDERLRALQEPDEDDLSGYLPAAEVLKVLPELFSGYNALRRYCNKKEVPTRKPTGRRLLIHAAKLLSSLVSDDPDNKELIGIVERYAQHREERDRLAGK